jgi:hypothetical protein
MSLVVTVWSMEVAAVTLATLSGVVRTVDRRSLFAHLLVSVWLPNSLVIIKARVGRFWTKPLGMTFPFTSFHVQDAVS